MHLLPVLQGQAADILHSGPAEAMYKDFRYWRTTVGTVIWLQHTISARIPCCHQAVGPLGFCQATPALYPGGGRLCIC